jgi:hypothetical protein
MEEICTVPITKSPTPVSITGRRETGRPGKIEKEMWCSEGHII